MKALPLLLCAFIALLSTSTLHAQLAGGQWETAYRFDGSTVNEKLGHSVAGAGDMDGDGLDDVLVGAPYANPGGLFLAGSVYLYSGATGALIRQFDGAAASAKLGSEVSGCGDLDGDGVDDVIVGAWEASPFWVAQAGSVYVLSGATGTTIWEYHGVTLFERLGRSVAGTGDLNGDGVDDFMYGAPFRAGGGTAFVHSGATGNLLAQFSGVGMGYAVSGIDDVDGDGVHDLIVGDPNASPGGLPYAGTASVFSGASWALVHQFDGAAGDGLGISVADLEDVDGDGVADLIVGATGTNTGSAYVYSGATGALIRQFDGSASGEQFGESVSGLGDMDGDGIGDLVVGAPSPFGGAGSVYVYSGATGGLLVQLDGEGISDRFGSSVSGTGDTDGDGLANVIVGAHLADPGGVMEAGSAYVFSLDPFLHPDSAELSVSSGSSVQLDLEFPLSESNTRYAVLASLTGTGPVNMFGLDIPLTPDPVFNRITSGNVPPILQGAFGTLNGNARAQATLSTGPALASAVGHTIHFAAVTYDVGPLAGRMSSVVRYLEVVP